MILCKTMELRVKQRPENSLVYHTTLTAWKANSHCSLRGRGTAHHLLLSVGCYLAEGVDELQILVCGELWGNQEMGSVFKCWTHAPYTTALIRARLTSAAPTLASSSRKISRKWLFTPLGAWLSGFSISVVSSSSSCSICLKREKERRMWLPWGRRSAVPRVLHIGSGRNTHVQAGMVIQKHT